VRRRPAGDTGASTVEFALVFPLFVGIVVVGAFFGWWAYTQAQIDRTAQRAARFAAVPTTTGTYEFCHSAVLAQVNDDLQSSTVRAAELVVTDSAGPAGPCPARPKRWVTVTIAHTFTNPFSSVVALLTPVSGTFTVTGTGRARVES
jgi:Flp pilus assembly protein TadG